MLYCVSYPNRYTVPEQQFDSLIRLSYANSVIKKVTLDNRCILHQSNNCITVTLNLHLPQDTQNHLGNQNIQRY